MSQKSDKYQLLIEHLPDAFAYHRVITDEEGASVDCIFLDINRAYEEMTGLKREAVIGRKITEVQPKINKSDFDWIGAYGKVALGGEPARFENYFEPLGRWFDVTVYSDEPGYFAVTFRDITFQKKEMLIQNNLSILLQENLQDSDGDINYQGLSDALLELSGAKFAAINIYDLDGKKTVTRAISGIAGSIRNACDMLGFELVGKAWGIIPERLNAIKEGRLLRFTSLYDSASGAIPKKASLLLEKAFGIGEAYVAVVRHGDNIVGDLIMYMARNTTLEHPKVIELFAAQVGMVFARKQAEEALQESEKHYRQMVDNTSDVIWTTDLNLNLTYVSPSIEKIIGDPVDVHLKRPMEEKFSLEDLDAISSMLREEFEKESDPASDKERSRIIEAEHYRADGSSIWIAMHISFIRDQNENVIGLQGITRDITERKQAEDKLLALKTFYENIVQNINEGVIIFNNSGESTFTNPSLLQMIGRDADQFLGRHWTLLVPPQYHQVVEEANARRSAGVSDRYEIEIKHKNGSLIPVQVSGSPFYDSKTGEMVGTLAVLTDISERKKNEEALKESEMRSRALIGAIPDMLFRFNREGVYLEAVIKDETMLHPSAYSHYQQNGFIGKSMAEVLPAPIVKKLIAGIEKTLASGEIQVFEYSYKTENYERHLEARMAPIGTIEVVSIVRDITDKKKQDIKLQYISFHDQLTGLYNRRYYKNELKRLDSSRDHPIAVISADIDGVKLVNDTFGHSEGDKYIRACAKLLKDTLRSSDILARVGGDEFAIILPRFTRERGQQLMERIEYQIEDYNRKKNSDLPLSISIGLAVSESSEQSLEETYKKADRAMYADKLKRSKKAQHVIVTLLLTALYKRSELFEGEREHVQALCLQLGRALSLDSKQMTDLELLSRVYDLGKVSLPDHVVHCNLLHKSEELTEAEREAIYRHPETGYRIASSSPELAAIAELILKHHENWDGSGYPLGLKREEIPIECRIVAIAIAYSAMTNPRPYAETLDKNDALAELQRCAGTQFDPELVKMIKKTIANESGYSAASR